MIVHVEESRDQTEGANVTILVNQMEQDVSTSATSPARPEIIPCSIFSMDLYLWVKNVKSEITNLQIPFCLWH